MHVWHDLCKKSEVLSPDAESDHYGSGTEQLGVDQKKTLSEETTDLSAEEYLEIEESDNDDNRNEPLLCHTEPDVAENEENLLEEGIKQKDESDDGQSDDCSLRNTDQPVHPAGSETCIVDDQESQSALSKLPQPTKETEIYVQLHYNLRNENLEDVSDCEESTRISGVAVTGNLISILTVAEQRANAKKLRETKRNLKEINNTKHNTNTGLITPLDTKIGNMVYIPEKQSDSSFERPSINSQTSGYNVKEIALEEVKVSTNNKHVEKQNIKHGKRKRNENNVKDTNSSSKCKLILGKRDADINSESGVDGNEKLVQSLSCENMVEEMTKQQSVENSNQVEIVKFCASADKQTKTFVEQQFSPINNMSSELIEELEDASDFEESTETSKKSIQISVQRLLHSVSVLSAAGSSEHLSEVAEERVLSSRKSDNQCSITEFPTQTSDKLKMPEAKRRKINHVNNTPNDILFAPLDNEMSGVTNIPERDNDLLSEKHSAGNQTMGYNIQESYAEGNGEEKSIGDKHVKKQTSRRGKRKRTKNNEKDEDTCSKRKLILRENDDDSKFEKDDEKLVSAFISESVSEEAVKQNNIENSNEVEINTFGVSVDKQSEICAEQELSSTENTPSESGQERLETDINILAEDADALNNPENIRKESDSCLEIPENVQEGKLQKKSERPRKGYRKKKGTKRTAVKNSSVDKSEHGAENMDIADVDLNTTSSQGDWSEPKSAEQSTSEENKIVITVKYSSEENLKLVIDTNNGDSTQASQSSAPANPTAPATDDSLFPVDQNASKSLASLYLFGLNSQNEVDNKNEEQRGDSDLQENIDECCRLFSNRTSASTQFSGVYLNNTVEFITTEEFNNMSNSDLCTS